MAALAPFWLSQVQGVPVGFIGMPLKGTPEIVAAAGIAGVSFGDEVDAANAYADILDQLGVKTIVLLVHHGDGTAPGSPPNRCSLVPGPGRLIAEQVSPKIDVVLGGHSHQQYNCSVNDPDGRPHTYLQGLSFGRIPSVVDLQIDRGTGDVLRD